MRAHRCETGCGRIPERPMARFCDACRWPMRLKKVKYPWTPEKDAYLRAQYDSSVRGRAVRIATVLGYPRWVVQGRASQLGLARPTTLTEPRRWTSNEVTFLNRHAGSRHVKWISRQLGRSITSVVVQIKRQGLSRLPDGYNQGEVALAFGVSRDTVERWFLRGWLGVRPRVTGQAWRVSEAALRTFVTTHREVFDLRKVDQVWFLDLLCGPPAQRSAVSA